MITTLMKSRSRLIWLACASIGLLIALISLSFTFACRDPYCQHERDQAFRQSIRMISFGQPLSKGDYKTAANFLLAENNRQSNGAFVLNQVDRAVNFYLAGCLQESVDDRKAAAACFLQADMFCDGVSITIADRLAQLCQDRQLCQTQPDFADERFYCDSLVRLIQEIGNKNVGKDDDALKLHRAELLITVANCYRGICDFARAQDLYGEAISIARQDRADANSQRATRASVVISDATRALKEIKTTKTTR